MAACAHVSAHALATRTPATPPPPPRIRMAQPDASLCTQTRQIKTMGMKIGERNRLSKWVAAQASSPSAACDAPLPAAHSWILRQPEPTEPRCSDVLRTVQADVGSWRKISAKSRPVQCSRGAVRVLRATRGRALGVVGHAAARSPPRLDQPRPCAAARLMPSQVRPTPPPARCVCVLLQSRRRGRRAHVLRLGHHVLQEPITVRGGVRRQVNPL